VGGFSTAAAEAETTGSGPNHQGVARRIPASTLPANAIWPRILSPHTAATCGGSFTWLNGRSIPALSIRDLADYTAWLHGLGLGPSTLARHLVSLKVFFRYLQLEGVLQDNLAELLGSQKLWSGFPRCSAPSRSTGCWNARGPTDPFWHRDRALLELLYATGCRAVGDLQPEVLRRPPGGRLLHVSGQGGQRAARPLGRSRGGRCPGLSGGRAEGPDGPGRR